MNLKNLLIIGLFAFWLVSPAFAITDPAIKNPWLDLYLEAAWLDWTTPTWFQPHDQNTAPQDLNYWLNILPYSQDKWASTYIVIPWLGLISPIMEIPEWSADYTNMLAWREIPINNYLRSWVLEYVSSSDPGSVWKRIDFAHSNHFTSDPWRYKTIFANLMWLDPGDQVRYFDKQADGSYELFKYNITSSYPTHPGNVQALQWDWEWADALIFWCYHWLDWRWMIEASYMWVPVEQYSEVLVEVKNEYNSVPFTTKSRVNEAISSLKYIGINAKKYEIIVLFKWIQKARAMLSVNDTNHTMKTELLDMLEEKLAAIYPE